MDGRSVGVNGPRRPTGSVARRTVRADEPVKLLGPAGEKLGVVRWALVAPYLEQDPPQGGDEARVRDGSALRAARGLAVRYRTQDGRAHAGVVRCVESSGLFVEGPALLPAGTAVEVTYSVEPGREVGAQGVVMWVCPKQDQYGFAAGLGVWLSAVPHRLRQALDGLDA